MGIFDSLATVKPTVPMRDEKFVISEFLVLKQESRNLRRGFSTMAQVRLRAVWPMENWLGFSLNQIQGWTTVRESYSRALQQGPLVVLRVQLISLHSNWASLESGEF